MKHNEIQDKIVPQEASSVNESAMQISNQVADMMREKMTGSNNINIIVLNQKEEMAAYDAAAKAKSMGDAADVTFKKDADGNLIKVTGDGAQSKKGNFPKNEIASLDFTSGDSLLFKKDEQGNLFKIQHDGGPKVPTYSNQIQPNWSDR